MCLSVVIMGRTKRQISRRRKSPAVPEKRQERGSSNRVDQSEKKRVREKTGNEERGEGEGSFFVKQNVVITLLLAGKCSV